MTARVEYRRATIGGAGQTPKAANTGGRWVFSGQVFAWDSPSDDLGGYTEVVKKGAAAKVLANTSKPIFALLDHERVVRNILGDTKTGTLSLVETDRGLEFIARPADTTVAEDAARIVQHNAVGVSIAMVVGKQEWATLPDGSRRRTILDLDEIVEISLVGDPAYRSSSVSAVAIGNAGARSAPRVIPIRVVRSAALPTVDFLRRQLEQTEMEFRLTSTPSI